MSITLTPEETRQFGQLFAQYEQNNEGIIKGNVAYPLFIKSGLSTEVLRQIWATADSDNLGALDLQSFSKALRMIYHVQSGRPFSSYLATIPARVPAFNTGAPTGAPGVASPQGTGTAPAATAPVSTDIPPLGTADKSRFGTLFDKHARDGRIDGASARDIFMKAKLSPETLSNIWNLVDIQKSGSLRRNEFILAMHLIQTTMSKQLPSIPAKLPPTWIPWLEGKATYVISPVEKQKYDGYFEGLQQDGLISAEKAADFLKKSNLSEDVLAVVWDLADYKERGVLDRQGFSIAMFLVNRKLNGGELPQRTPQELIDSAAAPPAPIGSPQMQNSAFSPQTTGQVASPPVSRASVSSPVQQQPQSQLPIHRNVSGVPHGVAAGAAGAGAVAAGAAAVHGHSGSVSGAPSAPQSRQVSNSLNDLVNLDDTFFGSSANLKSPVLSPSQTGAAAANKDAFVPKSSFGQSLVNKDAGVQAAPTGPSYAETQKQLNQTKEQHSELTDKLASTKEVNKQTSTELAALTEQKKALESELSQLRASYDKEAAQVHKNQQEIKALREEMAQLEKDHNLRKSGFTALTHQHKELCTQLETHRAKRDELNANVQQLEEQHNTHKKSLDDLTREQQELQQHHTTHTQRVSTLEAELSTILNHLEASKSAKTAAEKRVADSKLRADHVEAEVAKAREELKASQAQAEALAKQAAEHEAREKAARQQLSSSQAHHASVKETIERSQSQIAAQKAAPPAAPASRGFEQPHGSHHGGAIGAAVGAVGGVAAGTGIAAAGHSGHESIPHVDSADTSYKGTSTFSDQSSPRTSEYQIPDSGAAVPPSFTLPMARPQSATSSVANNPPQSVRGDNDDVSRPTSPEFNTSVPVNGIIPPQNLDIEETTEPSNLYAHSGKSSDSFEFVDAQDGDTPAMPGTMPGVAAAANVSDGSRTDPQIRAVSHEDDSSDDEGPEQLPHMRTGGTSGGTAVYSDYENTVTSAPAPSSSGTTVSAPSVLASAGSAKGPGAPKSGPPSYGATPGVGHGAGPGVGPSGSRAPPAAAAPNADFGDEFDDLEEAIEDESDAPYQSQYASPGQSQSQPPAHGHGSLPTQPPQQPQSRGEPDEWQQLFADTQPAATEKPLPAPPKNIKGPEAAALAELTSMGFPEHAALEALKKCNFNPSEATNLLLDE